MSEIIVLNKAATQKKQAEVEGKLKAMISIIQNEEIPDNVKEVLRLESSLYRSTKRQLQAQKEGQ